MKSFTAKNKMWVIPAIAGVLAFAVFFLMTPFWATGATIFGKETFETGSTPFSFDAETNDYGGATLTLNSTSKVNGIDSIALAATGESSRYMYKQLGSSYTTIYVQMTVMIPTGFSHPAGSFFSILNMGSGTSDAGWDIEMKIENYGTNRIVLQGDNLSYTDTGIDIPADTPTRIELKLVKNASTGSAAVYINGTSEGSPTYATGNTNTGATAISTIFTGVVYTPGTFGTMYIDDIIVSDTFIGDGEAPAAPIATSSQAVINNGSIIINNGTLRQY